MAFAPLAGPSLVSITHNRQRHYGVRVYIDWDAVVSGGPIITLGSLSFLGNEVTINPESLGPAASALELKSLVYTQSFVNNPPTAIGGKNFSGQDSDLLIYTPASGVLLTISNPLNVVLSPIPTPLTPPFTPTVQQVSGVMSFVNAPGGTITIAKPENDSGTASTSGVSAFTFFDFELPTWSQAGNGLVLS